MNWKYVCFGGAILSVTYLAIHLLLFLISLMLNNAGGGEAAALLSLFVFLVTSLPVVLTLKMLGVEVGTQITIIAGTLIYFLLGALIGFVVGKIKSKKSKILLKG